VTSSAVAALCCLVLAAVLLYLASRYARVAHDGLRTRHGALDTSIWGVLNRRAEDVLALNDADVYAGWRLARMNARTALAMVVIGLAIVAAL
jgi:hypothetical protein